MAKDVKINLDVNAQQANQELDKFNRKADQAKNSGTGIGENFNKGGKIAARGLSLMKTAIAGLGVGALIAGVKKLADGLLSLEGNANKLEITTAKAKGAWDKFLSKASSGDFTNFISDLSEAAIEAGKLKEELIEIRDNKLSLDLFLGGAKEQLANLKTVRDDTTKTDEVRLTAGEKYLKLQKKIYDRERETAEETYNNAVARAANTSDLDEETLDQAVKNFDKRKELEDDITEYNLQMARFRAEETQDLTEEEFADLVKRENEFIQSQKEGVVALSKFEKERGSLKKEDLEEIINLYLNVQEASSGYKESIEEGVRAVNGLKQSLKDVKDVNDELKPIEITVNDNLPEGGVDELLFSDKDELDALNEEINDSYKKSLEQREEIFDEYGERIREKYSMQAQEQVQIEQAKYNAFQQISSTFFSALDSLRQRELQADLKAAGDNEKKKAKIQREAFKKEKRAKFLESVINTALGITAALTVPPPAGPILAAVNAVTGGIQQALILSQPVPEFQSGGIVGGNSFQGDNIVARVNSGEMILNREQQSRLFNMLDGGTGTSQGLSDERIATIAAKTVRAIPVYVVESEISEANRKAQIRETRFTS